jgi:hypothetical protein
MSSFGRAKKTANELVARFIEIGLGQEEALLDDKFQKYNRLYDEKVEIDTELRGRGDPAVRALLPLLTHGSPQVRLNAAIATLAIAPVEARRVLQALVDDKEYPQAGYAKGMIMALDDGSYVPR